MLVVFRKFCVLLYFFCFCSVFEYVVSFVRMVLIELRCVGFVEIFVV